MSAGKRVVKIWDEKQITKEKSVCNIETMAPSSDLCMCPESGMMFLAGEQERLMVVAVQTFPTHPFFCPKHIAKNGSQRKYGPQFKDVWTAQVE